jgi:outer membrane protein OmpA-like peptidoglycan-associated protein
MVTLPRESWMVLAAAGGGVALVQTARLWWRASSVRWRLAEQSARATAGEALAETLLARAGYRIEARQCVERWRLRVDGEAREVSLRADFVVRRGRRRFVAEVKTGQDAPDIAAPATRRQLLEYRCAFAVDGVLLVDAEARTIQEIDFALPRAAPRRWWPLVLAIALGLLVGVALARADTSADARVVLRADRIELRDPIYFDTAKATIKQQSLKLLDAVAATLNANPNLPDVEIGVHTDERGADEYNLTISAARAQAIKLYLIERGVLPKRLEARGYGETKPLCPEHNEACWSKNRRVELLLLGRRR